jgi:hypothetical protein
MIAIQPSPEPDDFDNNVRKQGAAFLQTTPRPVGKEWANKEYWRLAIPSLITAYNSICAYCAQWISHPTGSPTVDHYIARSIDPTKAYEWDNFRLACLALNSRKWAYQDVLDPFQIPAGWFTIDFATFMILPATGLSAEIKQSVSGTVTRLRLNIDEAFIDSRKQWFNDYIDGEYEFGFLARRAPFIAYEVERQGLKRQ